MTRVGQVSRRRDRDDGWLQWDLGPASWSAWAVALGFTGLLGLAVLRAASRRPEWLLAWRLASAFLLFAGVLTVARHLSPDSSASGTDPWVGWRLLAVRLGLLAVLLVVVVQSGSPGFGPGVNRAVESAGVVAALVALCALADDPRRHTLAQWVALACFALVAGIYFWHALSVPKASVASRHPLWASVVMGVCLFVLPQLLPGELFLWAASRVAGVVVAVGLPVYLVGEYVLLGQPVRFHHSYLLPVVGVEVTAIRSFLVNQNALATVAMAGLVGAVAAYHRTAQRDSGPALVVPAVLVALSAAGLVLSIGRALWVVGLLGLGIYAAAALYGRDALPAAVGGAVACLLGGILAVYLAVRTGVLADDPSDRFHLWRASVDAIADRPTLLGAGTASPAEIILAYRDAETAASPHNSYLAVWIRTGIVGGLAYLAIVLASLLEGTRRFRVVDVAVLALAFAIAAHQLFEAYTMLWWSMGSVYASLAIGYLLFDDRWAARR